ncbi:hypothetical protein F4808DRAFT_462590 [Astrocystis sublimbata]|nr:hypothetical protein F4808DRAFT_462590 [Astrocystis sublimbata]
MGSDESDFYGENDHVAELEKKVGSFDVRGWWQQDQEALATPLKIQAQGGAITNNNSNSQLHNPYAGEPYAWQLTETVDAFLKRLPPATTGQQNDSPSESWIWICNPYIKRKARGAAQNQLIRGGQDEVPEDEDADLATFMKGGEGRLDLASSFINDQLRKPGVPRAYYLKEAKKAGMDAASDILGLANHCRVTCGKWLLFCTAFEVNAVWELIAKATAQNELGIAAKVAPKSNVDQRMERLICVYTADFSDKKDVIRVANKLKQLGLVKNKPIYYKPDAYTYLGIASGNPWEIRASIYDTRSLLVK